MRWASSSQKVKPHESTPCDGCVLSLENVTEKQLQGELEPLAEVPRHVDSGVNVRAEPVAQSQDASGEKSVPTKQCATATRTVLGTSASFCGETLERQCYGFPGSQGEVPFTPSPCSQRWSQDHFPVAVTPVSPERQCSVRQILVRVAVTGDGSPEELLAEQAQIEAQVRDSLEQFPIELRSRPRQYQEKSEISAEGRPSKAASVDSRVGSGSTVQRNSPRCRSPVEGKSAGKSEESKRSVRRRKRTWHVKGLVKSQEGSDGERGRLQNTQPVDSLVSVIAELRAVKGEILEPKTVAQEKPVLEGREEIMLDQVFVVEKSLVWIQTVTLRDMRQVYR